MNNYPPYQFSIFRLYTGIYLLIIFISAIPSAAAIWSNEGLVSKASSNLTYGVFPNILNHFDSPQEVKIFLIALAAFAGCYTIGFGRRWAGLFLWYGWTCLFNRNNLTLNPSIPYIGWLLLASCFVPTGEPWSINKKEDNWQMPKLISNGAWVLLILGYFFSGVDKLHSVSWANGTAIKKIMECHLGLGWNQWLSDNLPQQFFVMANWIAIGLELACLPLALFRRTRGLAWIFTLMLQVGISFILDIYPIVFGMLTILVFTFPATKAKENLFRPVQL